MSTKKEASDHPGVATQLSLLRPYLDGERPLKSIAAEMGISLRTARRWIKRLRDSGPAGLVRKSRSDAGHRKLSDDLLELVEGLALTKPKLSIATLHRKVRSIAEARGWRPPSYASIHSVVNAVDYGMARPSEDIEYDDPSLKEEEPIHDHFNLRYRHRQE